MKGCAQGKCSNRHSEAWACASALAHCHGVHCTYSSTGSRRTRLRLLDHTGNAGDVDISGRGIASGSATSRGHPLAEAAIIVGIVDATTSGGDGCHHCCLDCLRTSRYNRKFSRAVRAAPMHSVGAAVAFMVRGRGTAVWGNRSAGISIGG